jgi:hypothetical protein
MHLAPASRLCCNTQLFDRGFAVVVFLADWLAVVDLLVVCLVMAAQSVAWSQSLLHLRRMHLAPASRLCCSSQLFVCGFVVSAVLAGWLDGSALTLVLRSLSVDAQRTLQD